MGENITAEIHTLIVWSKATEHLAAITDRLQIKFDVVSVFEIEWSKANFLKNLIPFYAHSQQHLGLEQYRELLLSKISHCGDESFHLFVFRDRLPAYDFRNTSSGLRNVNTNIFDLKSELRATTNGGHKIHASDNTFESNKDLTILLGQNTEDFLKNLEDWRKVEKITSNCLGVGGFKNITELFYLLNNSIDYVVLRNFECLPEEYTVEGHGDIDLLVEDIQYVKYLTGATPVFPDDAFRVHHTIDICNTYVPFDFRYFGDNYYDRKWQENILTDKEFFKQYIPVPNAVDYFYSLLYHAYVQKYNITADYITRLNHLAKKAGLSFPDMLSPSQVKQFLDNFLDRKQYRYTVPVDRSVFYNTDFISLGKKPEKYGVLLSTQVARYGNKGLVTEVFYHADKKRIYKICPEPIASNEIRGLTLLQNTGIVPRIYDTTKKDVVTIIEMEFLEGIPLSQLFMVGNFWKLQNIKKIIIDTIKILEILIEKDILHRDIKPDNFLVVKTGDQYQIKIIDFGWSESYSGPQTEVPFLLGWPWAFGKGKFSDVFALGRTLQQIFCRFPTLVKLLDQTLLKYTPEENDVLRYRFKNEGQNFNEINLTPKEKFILIIKRYPKMIKFAKRIHVKLKFDA